MLSKVKPKAQQILVLLFVSLACNLHAQWPDSSTGPARHRIKASILDLSGIFLKTVKFSYEYKLKNKPQGWEAELGYTHYSKEEKTPVRGYFASLLGHYHLPNSNKRHRTIAKFMAFYQKIDLEHYLKYDANIPGIGPYFDYRKTKYSKERYGAYVMMCWQYDISRNWFFEFNFGVGLMRFITHVPDPNVTQEYYRNGLFNHKDYYSPSIMQNFKLGFSF